jgi:hypothetical protein
MYRNWLEKLLKRRKVASVIVKIWKHTTLNTMTIHHVCRIIPYDKVSWIQHFLKLGLHINMSRYGVAGKRPVVKIGKSQSQEESSDEQHHSSVPSSSAHSHQSLRCVIDFPAFPTASIIFTFICIALPFFCARNADFHVRHKSFGCNKRISWHKVIAYSSWGEYVTLE